jgi:hypothetical protein
MLLSNCFKCDPPAVFGLCSLWRLSKKLSKEHQARSYTQARKEATMTVIPDDPGTLRARLERTNQFASQARQAARRAAREAAAPYMTDHDRPRADE